MNENLELLADELFTSVLDEFYCEELLDESFFKYENFDEFKQRCIDRIIVAINDHINIDEIDENE